MRGVSTIACRRVWSAWQRVALAGLWEGQVLNGGPRNGSGVLLGEPTSLEVAEVRRAPFLTSRLV